MALPQSILQRGSRASQPAASAVAEGTLYCVTDENYILEQSVASSWVDYSPTGGSGTVTNTGTLTANALILGNGGVDVTPMASLGTTTTVLHGNAAGAPTFGAVSLTADVSGTLPVGNGGTGQTSYTDGQLLIGNSTGNTLTKATLTAGSGISVTNGSGAITIAATGGSSGLTLLESHTASSSSSLDFTTCISSTYDEYLIDFLNIIPASNSTLQMLMSTNGGSSYDTSNIYTWYSSFAYSVTTGKAGAANAGAFSFRDTTTTLTANSSYNGSVRFYNPGASVFKYLTGQHLFSDNSAGLITFAWGGQYASTTAVNAFRFNFASGNITSGTIRCYGVAK